MILGLSMYYGFQGITKSTNHIKNNSWFVKGNRIKSKMLKAYDMFEHPSIILHLGNGG